MKNLIKYATALILVLSCAFIFTACGNPDYKINTSVTKVQGVNITLDNNVGKKLFSTENGDSESRVFCLLTYI